VVEAVPKAETAKVETATNAQADLREVVAMNAELDPMGVIALRVEAVPKAETAKVKTTGLIGEIDTKAEIGQVGVVSKIFEETSKANVNLPSEIVAKMSVGLAMPPDRANKRSRPSFRKYPHSTSTQSPASPPSGAFFVNVAISSKTFCRPSDI